MTTLEEIRDGVIKALQDSSINPLTVESLINTGISHISERVRLPALDVSGSVVLSSNDNFLDIPPEWEYQRGLYDAVSDDRQILTVYPSIQAMRRIIGDTAHIQKGSVNSITVVGDKLHYFRSQDTTLKCRFFRHPPPLVNDTDELTCIPRGFSRTLTESYVLSKLWAIIEDGNEGPKTNTRFYEALFEDQLKQLCIATESGQPSPEHVRYPFWRI